MARRWILPVAVAIAVWGTAFTGVWRPPSAAQARRPSATARQADASMLTPFGPVVTYAKAWLEGVDSVDTENGLNRLY